MAIIEGNPKAIENIKEFLHRRMAFLWLDANVVDFESMLCKEALKPNSVIRFIMSLVPIFRFVSYLKAPRFVSNVTLTSVTPVAIK